METRLRALHDLLPAAHDFPGLAVPYSNFLRSLREHLHPIGVRHVREVKTASGLSFSVDLGERLGSDFYYGYLGELFESEILLRALDPGATLIDVGANFGYYAVSAGARIGADGTVFAFEPDPAAFQLLVANVEANRLANVRCHHFCIGPEDGDTDFYVMAESAFSGMIPTGRSSLLEKRTMPMRSLDSFLEEVRAAAGAEASAEAVAVIKIDVEGNEYAVLRGAWETIHGAPEIVLMVEVNAKNLDAERRTELASVLHALYEDGLRGWIIDTGADGVRPLPDPREAADLGSANLFIMRSGSPTETRLRSIARDLRREAFPEVAGRPSLTSQVLSRNAEDLPSGLNLHAALIGAMLRNREGEIEALAVRLRAAERDGDIYREELERGRAEVEALRGHLVAVEGDSQARLDELQRRSAEAAGLRERLDAVERDSQARLAELERRGREVDVLRTSLDAVEQDSRARLEGLHQMGAQIEALRARQAAAEDDSQARLDELEKRELEVQALRARLQTVEEESQARLRELTHLSTEIQNLNDQLSMMTQHEQTARQQLQEAEEKLRWTAEEHEQAIQALKAEVDAWKREAVLGLAQRVWRSVRRTFR